jgi:hypothetical protein
MQRVTAGLAPTVSPLPFLRSNKETCSSESGLPDRPQVEHEPRQLGIARDGVQAIEDAHWLARTVNKHLAPIRIQQPT